MWNYFFFIAYLLEKDRNDHTGVESYIHDLYLDQDVQWFPFGRALELDETGEDEDEQEKEVMRKLDSNVILF